MLYLPWHSVHGSLPTGSQGFTACSLQVFLPCRPPPEGGGCLNLMPTAPPSSTSPINVCEMNESQSYFRMSDILFSSVVLKLPSCILAWTSVNSHTAGPFSLNSLYFPSPLVSCHLLLFLVTSNDHHPTTTWYSAPTQVRKWPLAGFTCALSV